MTTSCSCRPPRPSTACSSTSGQRRADPHPLLTHLGSDERAIGVEPVAVNFERLTTAVNRNQPSAASSGQAGTTVPVITLDVLVAELGLDRLDAVKIDVEGLEVDVLHSATDTLRRFRPVVYGEFDNQLMPKLGVTFLDAWSLLEPLGYQCFSFRHRLHLVHRPDPSATLGHVVLATPDRLDGLAEHGLVIDWS